MAEVGGVGDIYCCGRASQGKLRPPADHLRARKVTALFGKYSKAALVEDGRVFWLDAGGSKDLNFKITDVKQIDFGESHALVLKHSGQVYSWGVGQLGQLGIGAKGVALMAGVNKNDDAGVTATSDLYQVWPLDNVQIKQVSCGAEHSAALAENGDLYVWGRGYEGQLGMAAKGMTAEDNNRLSSIQLVPRLVPTFLKRPVKAVSCGHRYTAVVTVAGEVWTWGEGGCGQLGYGRITKQTRPKLAIAKDPQTGAGFVSVSCGFAHTMALTSEGRVYSWGLNNYGQLGLGDDNKHDGPCPVPIDANIVDAQAVGHSSGALSLEGAFFTWGSGEHGKLFHGDAKGQAVFAPKAVAAFDGQYVARFVLADFNSYAFAPAQVRSLSLRYDPLVGGSDIELSGIGFFDSPSLVVRFQPVGQAIARASIGTFVWDKIQGRKYICAKTPRFPKEGDVVVELSLNGHDFTANGLTYRCYSQPEIEKVTPRYSNIRGGKVLKLEGQGLFDSPDVKVKFVDDDLNEEVVKGQVICEYLGRNYNPLTQEEYDEYSTYLSCTTPAFTSSTLPKPILTRVEVAMNGRHFEPVVLSEEEGGEDVFIFHDAVVKQTKPSTVPAEGGTMLEVRGASFFEGVQIRVGILYGEDPEQPQIKYAVVPAVYESTSVLRCKMPSTRYILGRDETHSDSYRAQVDVMAGTEVLTNEPFAFNYYNDPILSVSPAIGPLAGSTMVTLSSTDRPILPTAQPLVRFSSEDGTLDTTVQTAPTVISQPDGKEVYVIKVPTPALPAHLHPAAPEPQATPAPSSATTTTSPASISLSFAINGVTFSRQILSFSYYRLPTVKELSPVDGVPGDRILIKGSSFFASPLIRVRLTFGEGEHDTCVGEATFEGDSTQLVFILPSPSSSATKPPPYAIQSMGVAMNGQDYMPVDVGGGKGGGVKFTILDPNKPKKKK